MSHWGFSMKVAIITPSNRPEYHANLYEQFRKQNYPCELWVLADEPSQVLGACAYHDKRIHLFCANTPMTIGEKRNALIELSNSDIIVHFDDDDWYSPDYVSCMIQAMNRTNADLVKLGTWNWHDRLSGECGMFDGGVTDTTKWGYGFSYVYKRNAALCFPFSNISLREDIDFVNRLRRNGVYCERIEGMPQIVSHELHDKNTSKFVDIQKKHIDIAALGVSMACVAGLVPIPIGIMVATAKIIGDIE